MWNLRYQEMKKRLQSCPLYYTISTPQLHGWGCRRSPIWSPYQMRLVYWAWWEWYHLLTQCPRLAWLKPYYGLVAWYMLKKISQNYITLSETYRSKNKITIWPNCLNEHPNLIKISRKLPLNVPKPFLWCVKFVPQITVDLLALNEDPTPLNHTSKLRNKLFFDKCLIFISFTLCLTWDFTCLASN